ncbi:unnamed protein product [Caenorhabditis brenneri]
MDVRGDNRGVPREMYPHDEMHQMRQPPANRVLQPTAYVPPVNVPPQPIANNKQEVDLPNRDQNQGEEEEEEEDDEEHMSRFDANEDTVWIDSDGDEATEEIILKQNFFLPYSDHNYDTPTPEERVIHPIEGPFAIIGGLDEQGNVIRQYMPPGYEAYGEEFGVPDEFELADRAAAAERARLAQIPYEQQYQQQPHVVQQHYQLQPPVYAVPPVARNHMMYQPELGIAAAAAEGARPAQFQHQQQHLAPPPLMPQQAARQPVNGVPPYAGNHLEYEPVRVHVRGVVPMREEPYRPQHEYVAPQLVVHPCVSEPNNRAAPTAAILRETQQGQEHVVTRREQEQNHQGHNYDTSHPSKRTTHPQEGSLPNIGGLDEEGYEADREEVGVPNVLKLIDRVAAATEEARPAQIQHQQQHERDLNAVPGTSSGQQPVAPWVMRCRCEMDHHEDAPLIECMQCKAWQHTICMGLDPRKEYTYKCEICLPRKLHVSKERARKMQFKFLKEWKKAKEIERSKKEEESKKTPAVKENQNQQPSTSRNAAPMPIRQHRQQQQQPQRGGEIRVRQRNEYSKAAAQLLASMDQTAGADKFFEEARSHKKARRMIVDENVEALVTNQVVAIHQVILEMNGHVSMSNEVKRQPGGGNSVYMYDGLMNRTAREEMVNGQELVCVDTKKKGNVSRFTRRSCIPNCVLKHVLASQATLGIMIVATKDIHIDVEVTLPFDTDWRDSDVPLECAEHLKELQMCPFEAERRRYANERHRSQETERRKAEEARRADEERRRLEDEVRLELAAGTRQMDEEAEQGIMASNCVKKTESDKADNKKLKRMDQLPKKVERACKKEAMEKLEAKGKASEKKRKVAAETNGVESKRTRR